MAIPRFARQPETWVAVVAVLYAAAQLTLLDLERFLTWDEAVYISEVSPFADSVSMGPTRARGITFVVAPLVSVTDSIVALRIYLAAVSAGVLYLSFRVWYPLIRWGAVLGAAIFASSWISVLYGNTAYPNLYSAFAAVAAIGLGIRYVTDPTLVRLIGLALLVAATAFIRPLDGLTLGAGLAIVALLVYRTTVWRYVAVAASGFSVGVLPWIVESFFRFDGPIERLRWSSQVVGGGLHNNVGEYLLLINGPHAAPDPGSPAERPLLWLLALLVLGGVGAVFGSRSHRRVVSLLLLVALLSSAPYLFGAEDAGPRFMLPALGFLCLAAGCGLAAVAAVRLVPRQVMISLLAVAMLAISSWNLTALSANEGAMIRNSSRAKVLGEEVRVAATGNDCFVLSPTNHPAVSVASGCDSLPLGPTPEINRRRTPAGGEGFRVFALLTDEPSAILGPGWRCTGIADVGAGEWQLCERS